MSYFSSKLFHKGRTGKIFSWRCWTEGADIYTEYGPDDGKKQLVCKRVEGKNAGKKNSTTPSEQADKEALAMYIHKLDRKYSKTKKKAKEVCFLPMLAHDYTKKYLKRGKSLKYPVDIQPKIDGVRCMAFWGEDGETIKLMSRGGKPWFIPHIAMELAQFLPQGFVLDGELYIHGRSLQNIIHLVKNDEDPDHILIEFHIFDGFYTDNLDEPWIEREKVLWDLIDKIQKTEHIRLINTETIDDEQRLFEMLTHYEEAGYEGIIIRLLQGKYNLGHRSPDLLKLKNFMDDEFEVVGYHHGSGREKDCVVWDCITKEGIKFGARPMGTVAEREQMLRDAEQYISKKLTIKYQGKSDDGVPIFPVAVCFRNNLD